MTPTPHLLNQPFVNYTTWRSRNAPRHLAPDGRLGRYGRRNCVLVLTFCQHRHILSSPGGNVWVRRRSQGRT
jgi:hypothetical protein